MTLPCSYLIFDVCDGYYGCKCSNGYEMTTHDTITIELIDDDDEDNEQTVAVASSGGLVVVDIESSEFDNEIIDVDFLHDDELLLRYIVYAAGILFLGCSIPCLCIVCCCCRRSRMKLCAGEHPPERRDA